MSDADRAARLEALLDLALDAAPDAREVVLESACAGDGTLLREVRALLRACDEVGAFLETPAGVLLGLSERDAIEDTIGPWQVLRELGRGGMGTVYLAERETDGFRQQAALKLIRGPSPPYQVVERFLAERRILASLEHPNLARFIDGGRRADGSPWFAMEFVEGERVTTWCDQRHLAVHDRLRIFEQVALAVAYSHRHLVVHRDIKPSNVLVTADGTAKLLDFGIARVLVDDDRASTDHTLTGLWVLTPEYAAPEQVRGGPITTATDVYALGAVLYELLTGRSAQSVSGRSPRDIEHVVCEVEPRRAGAIVLDDSPHGVAVELAAKRSTTPAALARTLSGDLETIIARALQKEPARRYPSVEHLLDDLQRHRSGLPVLARPDTVGYRTRKFVRRHRLGVAASVVTLLALTAGVAATMWQARRAGDEARRANATRDFVLELFHGANPDEALAPNASARQLIDRGLHRIDSSLAGQPEVQQELLGVLGVTYRELGLLPQADSALRRAVKLATAAFGEESEPVAARLTELGTIRNAAGDFPGADTLLSRALAIRRTHRRSNDQAWSATLGEVANNVEDLGDFARAESLHREVLAFDAARLGPGSLVVATDLSNLGVTLEELDKFVAAESAYQRALDVRVRALPTDHPSVLTTLGNIAVLRNRMGDYAAGESLSRESLVRRRRTLGPDHPDVAYSLQSLATALENQGKLLEAGPMHREALLLRRRTLGPDHPITLSSANNLAVLQVRIGAFDSAAATFRDIARRWNREYGPRHTRTATVINNLGVALVSAGHYAEGERELRLALDVRRASQGDSATDVGVSRRNLAVLFARTGRWVDAEREAQAALRIFEATLPPGHPRFSEVWTTQGEIWLARGQLARAESVLVAARATQLQALPGYDYRRAETAALLAQVRIAGKQTAVADSLLAEAETAYRQFPAFRQRAAAVARERARLRRS